MSAWQTGIDVGGTNTDVLLLDAEARALRTVKVPTTPADQASGVLDGIAAGEVAPARMLAIVHGTTIATNAVLERKGARCGLITTRGFRDVLELGRRTRPHGYGLFGHFEAIVDRELRLEVTERLDARGRVLVPLDEAEVVAALERLRTLGAEALVIHFLHSYANPEHELRALELAREHWPTPYLSASSEILREVREFERGSTAAVNAYVQPTVAGYLERLSERLAGVGFPHPLLIMQGNGGTISAAAASRQPVQTVMSGPAAGTIAAARIGMQAGFPNLIACDMGGTSFDVSLVAGGEPALSAEKDVAYGVPVRVPMVDIHTVGAGGGSIARVDAGGILRVGPESAGADPGPACYGRGGERPTVTDANAMLGRVDPAGFAGIGGSASLAGAEEALERHVGEPLGLGVAEAAAAVIAVAENQLASAIRLVSIEKGHDPRDFALFAFGGAGALHAVALARELGVPKVLVPRFPGITSALGCVLANLRHDFVHTLWRPLREVDPAGADRVLAEQAAAGRTAIEAEAVPVSAVEVRHEADLLYQGQSHVFRIPVESPGFAAGRVAATLTSRYRARFEIELTEMTPVLAGLRTTVVGRRSELDLTFFGNAAREGARPGPRGRRVVYFDGAPADTPVYGRDALAAGNRVAGPAILESADATVLLDPGAEGEVDPLGNLVVTV